jgi:hypothetical protein
MMTFKCSFQDTFPHCLPLLQKAHKLDMPYLLRYSLCVTKHSLTRGLTVIFNVWQKAGITVNNTEVLYQLEQARLSKLRQEAHLRSLIKSQHPSLRVKTAQTLKQWAYRLSPELELQHQS